MNENPNLEKIIQQLRAMASDEKSVADMLRYIQTSFGLVNCGLISVKCFHKAFGGGVAAISPVGGWSGFGGELSDAQVESFVSPVIERYRNRLEQSS